MKQKLRNLVAFGTLGAIIAAPTASFAGGSATFVATPNSALIDAAANGKQTFAKDSETAFDDLYASAFARTIAEQSYRCFSIFNLGSKFGL